MTNGDELNKQLEFREHISNLGDRELLEWTANETRYQRSKLEGIASDVRILKENCPLCKESRRPIFSARTRKWAVGAGVPVGFGGIIYLVIEIVRILAGRGGN